MWRTWIERRSARRSSRSARAVGGETVGSSSNADDERPA